MKTFFKEYGSTLLNICVGIVALIIFVKYFLGTRVTTTLDYEKEVGEAVASYEPWRVATETFRITQTHHNLNSDFNPEDFIYLEDNHGVNISNYCACDLITPTTINNEDRSEMKETSSKTSGIKSLYCTVRVNGEKEIIKVENAFYVQGEVLIDIDGGQTDFLDIGDKHFSVLSNDGATLLLMDTNPLSTRVSFNSDNETNDYAYSDINNALNDYYESLDSNLKDLIVSNLIHYSYSSPTQGQKQEYMYSNVYILSEDDVKDASYGFTTNETRKKDYNYWLRNGSSYYEESESGSGYYASYVNTNGTIEEKPVTDELYVVPVFQIEITNITDNIEKISDHTYALTF